MTKSPRRLKQVQDTVGEQVRDLPLHAVRLAMFGVGRALLLSDRVTKDYREIRKGNGRQVLDHLRDDAQHTAEKVVTRVRTRIRSEEETEEVRPAPPKPAKAAKPAEPAAPEKEIAVGKPAPEPAAAPAPKPSPAPSPKPPQAEPVAKAAPEPAVEAEPGPVSEAEPTPAPSPAPEPKSKAKPGPSAADLPVPDYDQATLPQLRARLRGLSADQVKLLREYERQHAARAEVLRMYENRISKLNGT